MKLRWAPLRIRRGLSSVAEIKLKRVAIDISHAAHTSGLEEQR